jgi:DNA-binding transcriptional ArsR family regulator
MAAGRGVASRDGPVAARVRRPIIITDLRRRLGAGDAPRPLDMQPKGCIIAGMDDLFKALADPGRRRLLDALHRRNGQTLGELVGLLDMTRQAASKHLALLEKAELVVIVWEGREKRHYLNPVPLAQIAQRWIRKFEEDRVQAVADLKGALEGRSHERTEVHLRHPHRRAR